MTLKKHVPIIRTHYPYLTDEEKEYYRNYEKELERKNMTREDRIREIFSKIGIDADLENMTFTKIEK